MTAETNSKAWFTSPLARISYRKVDVWAEYSKTWRPYFPTWAEAHAWMMAKAAADLETAERNLASIKRHVAKLKAMKDPEDGVGA